MATRYWMAPDGKDVVQQYVHVSHDDSPMTWDGKPGREIIPVVVGSREYAVVMAMRGERVNHALMVPAGDKLTAVLNIMHTNHGEDGWHLLPPSPPPIRKGDRVRWWRGEDSGTGTYEGPVARSGSDCSQSVVIGDHVMYVERVKVTMEVADE